MSVEIIILKFNADKLEKDCIRSVVTKTKCPYSLTIHDNYEKKENIGKLWNELIGRSKADFICLLNSDTVVEEEWLDKLLEVFNMYPDCGAVGPSTNSSGNKQEMEKSSGISCYSDENEQGYLCGFCLVFKKEDWSRCGGFPENYGFYGQEFGFLERLKKIGKKQYHRKDVFIWHKGHGSAILAEKRGEMNFLKELQMGRNIRDEEKGLIRKAQTYECYSINH